VKGTTACQKSDGQAQVLRLRRRGTRVIRRKLDCLIAQSPDDEKVRPPERHPKPAPCSATASHLCRRNLRSMERCPVRAIKEMSAAPRGALLYPRFSREELGGMFLDLMPNPASKDKRDSSLAENQRPCPGVWSAALGDPRDMVKAVLLDSPVSRRRNSSSAGKTSVTGARSVVASRSGCRNLQGVERCPVRAFKEANGTPKSRYIRTAGTNVGSPTGREPYGDGVPIVVVRFTPHQGGRESRPQGDMLRATYRPLCCAQNYVAYRAEREGVSGCLRADRGLWEGGDFDR
jgi:hypothetical protein